MNYCFAEPGDYEAGADTRGSVAVALHTVFDSTGRGARAYDRMYHACIVCISRCRIPGRTAPRELVRACTSYDTLR